MKTTCGIDEAGRGALAGPLVAAAVSLNKKNTKILEKSGLIIADSKILSKLRRETVYNYLANQKIPFDSEIISAKRINNQGIGWANKEIIKILIRKIDADSYIVDGNLKLGSIKGKDKKIKCIIDSDANILPVILAGIVAKVTRDRFMDQLHKLYYEYNWNTNYGYGTAKHIQALILHGVTKYHRKVFVTTAIRNRGH